jgi:hypothetical protein
MNLNWAGTLTLVLCTSTAFAQSGIFDNCRSVITDGLKEYSINTDSSAYLNSVFDRYCESSGSTKSSSFGLGLDTVVKAIPLNFTGNFSSNEEAIKNFCRNYSSLSAGRSDKTSYQEKIVQRAYESFDQCVSLAQTGVIVRHSVRSLENIDFYVAPGFSRPVTIKGVKASGNIECRGQDPNATDPKDKKFELSTRIKLHDSLYEEGVITLLTDISPNGNYAAFVPKDLKLAQDRASEIDKALANLAAENASLKQQLKNEQTARENREKVQNKWILYIYGQAKSVGMPNHQGANGYWQQGIISSHDNAAKELPH